MEGVRRESPTSPAETSPIRMRMNVRRPVTPPELRHNAECRVTGGTVAALMRNFQAANMAKASEPVARLAPVKLPGLQASLDITLRAVDKDATVRVGLKEGAPGVWSALAKDEVADVGCTVLENVEVVDLTAA